MLVETRGEDYDRSNPLWREQYIFTGEQRGPRTKDSFPPRLPGRLPTREPLRFTAIHGGEQQQQQNFVSSSSSSSSFNGPPALLDRWLQHHRSRKGTITIDLGEPEVVNEPVEEINNEVNDMEEVSDLLLNETNFTSVATGNQDQSDNRYTHTTLPLLRVPKLPRPIMRKPELPPVPKHQNVELSISITPTSLLRLIHNLLQTSAGFAGAFGATLRLLAPMILARRVISTVGYICYDYYNGRYIRTTYNKHSELMQQYEIPSALRACSRMGLQLLSMVVVGTIVRIILNPAPCLMPTVACHYWYGSIWVTSVLLASQSMRYWVSGGRFFYFSLLLLLPWTMV